MKYAELALVAGVLFACNDARDEDRMEDRPTVNDDAAQERTYDSREMNDANDDMRGPIDRVNPPEDLIPYTHEIRNDSVIAPIEGGDGGYHTGSKANEAELEGVNTDTQRPAPTTSTTTTGAQPVMPEDNNIHHSPDGIGTVEDAPAGTTHVPITEDGVRQTPGTQHMSQDGSVPVDTTDDAEMNMDSLLHHEQMPQEP